MRANRWTIARRVVQLAAVLLLASPALGWKLFSGNLDSASLGGLLLSDPLASLQLLLLTGGLALPLVIGTGTVLVFYGLLGGRSFCGWICPVGLLTDLADLLPGRRNRPGWRLSGKNLTLLLILALSLLLGIPAFETVSPIGIAGRSLSFGPGPELVVLGLIVVAELLLVRRLWCRSICPLGGFYALLGRLSPLAVGFRTERCSQCGRCREVCSVAEVLDPSLDRNVNRIHSGECSRCGACIGICPDDALHFTLRNPLTTQGDSP